MKPELSRAIARKLVVAATMGLAVLASWAVTGVPAPVIETAQANACSSVVVGAGDRGCKTVARQD